jgi:hypothetical protein
MLPLMSFFSSFVEMEYLESERESQEDSKRRRKKLIDCPGRQRGSEPRSVAAQLIVWPVVALVIGPNFPFLKHEASLHL